ncbi:hypothetical protein [Propylenella binzhouense]|uniref:Uncharacterized protein n=1 Tax=Propylenella binzhouense TaxID=2555902 RepID=A0A964WRV5_9HYPH|nr:hypothetical protein [Propylenella binzhouense]MYZ46206.1 hypothetical protein [Propylenella binzhouense]
MEGTGFLAVAGLIAALAIMAGLWEWRRRSRTSSFETVPRTAAATLRVSAPEVTRSDPDVDSGSLRPGPSVKTALDSPAGASAAIPAGPALAGPAAAAHPTEAPGEDEAPAQSDAPEVASQPPGPSLPIPPPPPPPAKDEAGPVSPHDGDEPNGPEPILQPADSGAPVLETASQAAETATGGTVAQEASVTAHQDGAEPLPPSSGIPDAPGDADPAEADGQDDAPQEGIGDQPDAHQQTLPCAEPDADTAGLLSPSADEARPEDTVEVEPEPGPDPALPPAPEAPAGPAIRPRQPTVHRDRRGKRRAVTAAALSQTVAPTPGLSARPPAEARLRLSLHPIRRVARLSVVLTRPDGFPARVTVLEAGGDAVEAYDEQRYDDLDLPWTSELLEGELRLTSADGFQWLRSARQVHIFAQDPNEPELISTSAARASTAHTLICRSSDAEAVRLAAAATGSPELQTHEHWQGIPDGWLVLSGYTPVHAAAPPLPSGFRTMDPGEGLEISFNGGLAVRARVYAAGHPPRIIITPAPGVASVTIGGMPAELSSDGAWTAPGWDRPGQHMVDIVPGPSVSYEIAADPWLSGGWDFWDAHPQRFFNGAGEPWARARICGARIRGPADEIVFAAETQPTLVALGARAGATPLRRRADAAVSVGLVAEPPAFLLSATGPRRSQGRVVWLGLAPAQSPSRRHDAEWVAIVRSAAARRLPLVQADAPGEDAWRKAKERARRLRNRRPRP